MAAKVLGSIVSGQVHAPLLKNGTQLLQQCSVCLSARHLCFSRCAHTSQISFQESADAEKQVQHQNQEHLRPMVQSQFNALIDSAKHDHKHLTSRDQFSLAVNQFLVREKYRKGHVGFIRVALQRMDEFGLENDLATYNKILEVFPKDRFKPRRMLDALWPRSLPQMELALELLTKMEDHGVNPSLETYQIVKDVFGGMSFPLQKCIRMMYLFDKYENADPYKIEGELPSDPVELARLSLKRISGNDGQILEHKVPCDEHTNGLPFLLSASSGSQVKVLQSIDETEELLFHVEGPHRLWLRKTKQHYFSLKVSRKDSTDQLKDEGAVLGVCMCDPATQESLQDWLGALQETYPSLSKATVVYNIRKMESSDSSNDANIQLPPHRTSLSSGDADKPSYN